MKATAGGKAKFQSSEARPPGIVQGHLGPASMLHAMDDSFGLALEQRQQGFLDPSLIVAEDHAAIPCGRAFLRCPIQRPVNPPIMSAAGLSLSQTRDRCE